jgi:hypothetical protein
MRRRRGAEAAADFGGDSVTVSVSSHTSMARLICSAIESPVRERMASSRVAMSLSIMKRQRFLTDMVKPHRKAASQRSLSTARRQLLDCTLTCHGGERTHLERDEDY